MGQFLDSEVFLPVARAVAGESEQEGGGEFSGRLRASTQPGMILMSRYVSIRKFVGSALAFADEHALVFLWAT